MSDNSSQTKMVAESSSKKERNPWSWVPSLYFAEGIPYVLVMTVSVAMYKKLGVSNRDIALFTSLLYLPWVIKPLWSPLVDLYWTKRNWSTWLQLLMGIFFLVMAFTLNTPVWWLGSLGVFTIIAFASATHDIAADGFYMLGLSPHHQTFFTGIRSTFYRFAMIFGMGFLPALAGYVETHTGPTPVPIDVHAAGEVQQIREIAKVANPFVILDPAETLRMDAGTTAAVGLRLTNKPDKPETIVSVAVNPSKWYNTFFPIGNERLVTMEGGDRLVFTPENWDQPQDVVIKVNEKLNQPVQAVFLAKSGNIPMSWMSCFVLCGILFVCIALYHMFVLPKPSIDHPMLHEGEKPAPFLRAAGGLALSILVPIFACIGMFYGVAEFLAVCFPVTMSGILGVSAGGDADALKTALSAALAANTGKMFVIKAIGGAIGLALIWFVTYFFSGRNNSHEKGIGFMQASAGQKVWSVVLIAWVFWLLLHGGHSMVRSLAAADTTIPADVFTFGADFLIIVTMILLMTAKPIGNLMLSALHGAARLSGMAFDDVFISFFQKPGILRMIALLLLYRLGESMLIKLSGPFLIGPRDEGALGLTLSQYGAAYGTLGVLCLLIGGITGGFIASKYGLKKCIWWMFLTINLNHLLYVFLAYARPTDFTTVLLCVGGEQLGYGIGFTAYMIYMLYIAGESENKTSHFAICTGFMALGMMLPGMISGAIYDLCKSPAVLDLMPAGMAAASAGYPLFFVCVVAMIIPGAIALCFAPIDPEFGKKTSK